MRGKTNLPRWPLCVQLLIAAVCCTAAAGGVIYVDADPAGANDGSSWADAFNYLQDALTTASSGDEIHVAQGTYRPDQGANETPGHRTATFQLLNGVVIKGGYAGFGGPDPDARDIDLYKTILSGDLNGDDGPDFTKNSENSYHVVTGSGTNETAVLDGCIITAGNAHATIWQSDNESGGGMYNESGSPTLINCTFIGNRAGFSSGAVHNVSGSNPTLNNCTFVGNSAQDGGAMKNYRESSPAITNCTFSSNRASCRGGAIYNQGVCSPTLTNCKIIGNTAGVVQLSYGFGGGICNRDGCNLVLVNCLIAGNLAKGNSTDGFGGGICFRNLKLTSALTLINCTLTENSAPKGNALACYSHDHGSPTRIRLANCVLWDGYSQIWKSDNSTIGITYSDVKGGFSGEGNIDADPRFAEPGYWDTNGTPKDDNDDVWVGGDYHLKSEAGRWDPVSESWLKDDVTSPCTDAGDNSVVSPSASVDLDGNPRIVNGTVDMGAYEGGTAPAPTCYYVDAVNGDDDNDGLTPQSAFAAIQKGIDAAANGDAVLVYPGLYQEEINFLGKTLTVQGAVVSPAGVPVLQNPGDFAVSFYRGEGPGSILKNLVIRDSFMAVFLAGSSPTITNLTIVDNRYGIEAYAGSEPDISNSIFWNNTGSDLFGCRARYCRVTEVGAGQGNIDADPLFVDPDVGDYHLRSERGRYWPEHDIWVLDKVTSPCVDGGDPNAQVLDEPTPNGGLINMGAYGGTAEASLSPWRLTRLPDQASDASPADGAVGVQTLTTLSWTAGERALWHEVYFGTNPAPGAAELVSERQMHTTFEFVHGLTPHTTYYWRVDEVNCGGKTTGEIWTFTTGSPVPPKGRICFTGETRVWSDEALIPISSVGLGQNVGRMDGASVPGSPVRLQSPGKVEEIQEHEGTFVCYDVLLESGNCIGVAECHYFLTESGRWVSLQNLQTGTRLQTSKGSMGIISVTKRPMPYVGKVYNLKIEGSDRYPVGEDAVIVRDY